MVETSQLELDDIQGLVVSAYAHLPCAAFRLLHVEAPGPARQWLGGVIPDVTTAAGRRDGWSINVAISHTGLTALELPADVLATFAPAFIDGIASPRRAVVNGDRGTDAPEAWEWGGPRTPDVHIILLVYATDEVTLAAQLARWPAGGPQGLTQLAVLQAGRQPDTREHFGFVDGIGQPVIAGSGRKQHQLDRTGHATEVPPGEFILGYQNAYGQYTPGPSVHSGLDPTNRLPTGQAPAGRHDLGRNGSYLVFRQLAQDVAGFWKTATDMATRYRIADVDALAAKLVGRWPSGAPLVLDPASDPQAGTTQPDLSNDFEYAKLDPRGAHCPFGAHIRRANPRDGSPPDPATSLARSNRHRLLRRGRSYGTRLADRMVDDKQARGLHFICLNGDLERQFEFVQQTWLNNPNFATLPGETDPLTSGEEGQARSFTIPGDLLRTHVQGIQSFVRTRGGVYCFLPGLRALQFIARSR